MDLEQSVEYNIEVSHLSSVGVFAIRDPSGRAAIHYRWRNPPESGRGVLFEPLSSGIHRLEIEGVCHLQVLRCLRIQVDGNATTLKGLLDEKRSMYGYWIWVWQSGAEHPSDLVEVEVKLKVPEEADFNLCSADRFLTEPMSTKTERSENQEKTLVFGNGPEGLLLFVQRVSGEGAYALTVQAYTAYWKAFSLLAITIVVCSLSILGLIVLLRSVERGKNETQGSSGSSR